jgi:uncharacterized membrane protein
MSVRVLGLLPVLVLVVVLVFSVKAIRARSIQLGEASNSVSSIMSSPRAAHGLDIMQPL